MAASRTAMEQARELEKLVAIITTRGGLWTAEERHRSSVLVGLLAEHSLAAERGKAA